MRLRWWTAAALALIALNASTSFAQQALNKLERSLSQAPAAKQSAPEPRPPGVATTQAAESDEPGYLGIIADDRDTQGRGVRLLDVLAGGPAAVGGLQLNDLITSIDGVAVTSLDDMAGVMKDRVVGEEVTFVVLRGERAATLNVVLSKRPPPEQRRFKNFGRIQDEGVDVMVPGDPGATPSVMPVPTERSIPHPEPIGAAPSVDDAPPAVVVPVNPNSPVATAARTGLLGIRAVRITPELQLAMNLPEPRGALVVEVHPDSPAKAAGIPIDAVITAADGKAIDEPEDLGEIVRERGPGAELRLSYFRYGQLFERRVKLAAPLGALDGAATVDGPALSTGPAAPAPAPGPAPGKREPEAVPSGPSAEEAKVRARIAEIERELAELKRQLGDDRTKTQPDKKPDAR